VPLKTERSRRTVELPDTLVSLLRGLKLQSPASGPNDYVFAARDGKPHDHRNVAGRALARAVKRAGLDSDEGLPAPTFHSLRHGFASSWIASGGDLVELSAHLGHRDPSVTAAVYSHEFESAARSPERRARLDAMFGTTLAAADGSEGRQTGPSADAEVVPLQAKDDRR